MKKLATPQTDLARLLHDNELTSRDFNNLIRAYQIGWKYFKEMCFLYVLVPVEIEHLIWRLKEQG